MNDLKEVIKNIDALSKAELAKYIQLCDKAVKLNETKIRETKVSLIKLKLANKRDEIKHQRQILVSRFHQV
jgi:hypothetical protein